MPYSPPNPNNSDPDRALGPTLLTGVFSAVFILTLILVFARQFLLVLPGATLAGVIGLSLIYSIYYWLVRDLRLPFSFHLLFFLFIQWLGLFRICLEQGSFPAGLMNPFALIGTQPVWFIITVIGGAASIHFNSTLLALHQLPKVTASGTLLDDWLYSATPWEQNWKSWRTSIFVATFVTAISYVAGYSWLGLKSYALWAGILLWLQFGIGVWLIFIGYYYYRRAVWKAVDLAPDSETKRVWGWGLVIWFGIGALISLVLPVSWQFNQWWLLRFLLRVFQFLFGFRYSSETNSQMPNIPKQVPEALKENYDWVTLLLNLVYYGMALMLALGGLLLLFIIIGAMIKKFLGEETDRLKGLPKALLKLYLFFRNWWRKRRQAIGRRRLLGSGSEEAGDREANDLAGTTRRSNSFGHGPRAVIRRGYYRLIQSARQSGYAWRKTHTPQEIAADLNSQIPQSEEALTGIADSYQQARYGPKPPTGGLAQLFERLRREVQNRLRFMK